MKKTLELGMSIYFSSSFEEIKEIMEKMVENKMEYIFSSINIQEIEISEEKLYSTIKLAKELNLKLIIDVNSSSLEKYPLNKLREYGLTHIRIDDGVTIGEIYELSKDFTIVLNASTILSSEMDELKRLGMDFKKIIACHNYYPKEYTGLSMEYVKSINERLKKYDMYTMAFIPGDAELRAPMYEGLPTVEKQRRQIVIENILEMEEESLTDIVMIGDIGLSRKSQKDIRLYKSGIIPLKVEELEEDYEEVLLGKTFKDRIDSSDYMIRVQDLEIPGKLIQEDINPRNYKKRRLGDICLSNIEFKRYMGQVEIIKKDMPKDDRVNIIGEISDEYKSLIKYIKRGRKFKII